MASLSRLATALEDTALALPTGPVAVLRPQVETDLAAIADRDLTLQHTDAQSIDAFAAAGYRVVRDPPSAPTSLVVVPRSKALARGLIAQAARRSTLVIVDGQRTDGVDSLFKACRARLGDLPSVPKAKGRLFWFEGTTAFDDWAVPAPSIGPHGFYTTAGVFSDGEVDEGSRLLAQALPDKLPGRMADLGAGWGYLSDAVLSRRDVASLDLIETEALALDCARLNVTDARATFHWADALSFRPAQPLDGIVMNPPFHQGAKGTPALGQGFIAAAARLLSRQGHLWMVANRHLPYEAELRARFARVEELPGSGAFKLFHAARPHTP